MTTGWACWWRGRKDCRGSWSPSGHPWNAGDAPIPCSWLTRAGRGGTRAEVCLVARTMPSARQPRPTSRAAARARGRVRDLLRAPPRRRDGGAMRDACRPQPVLLRSGQRRYCELAPAPGHAGASMFSAVSRSHGSRGPTPTRGTWPPDRSRGRRRRKCCPSLALLSQFAAAPAARGRSPGPRRTADATLGAPAAGRRRKLRAARVPRPSPG